MSSEEMTPQIRKWVAGAIDKNDDEVARVLGITPELAARWKKEVRDGIELQAAPEYRLMVEEPKPKKRTRGPNKPKPAPESAQEVKKTLGEKIHDRMNKLLDGGALWFAVAIDLVLNGIGFWIIGPDPVMKVGMVCVSVIVVLFSVRAWIKGNRGLWLMFAFVASFMDTSFVLLATDVQSENVGVDTELVRLTEAVDDADAYLKQLQALQVEKGQGYATQVRDQTLVLQEAQRDRQRYTDTPHEEKNQMSASKVATAIPDAVLSGKMDRWIFLLIFSLVFLGLQATICVATGVKWDGTRNEEPAQPPSHP